MNTDYNPIDILINLVELPGLEDVFNTNTFEKMLESNTDLFLKMAPEFNALVKTDPAMIQIILISFLHYTYGQKLKAALQVNNSITANGLFLRMLAIEYGVEYSMDELKSMPDERVRGEIRSVNHKKSNAGAAWHYKNNIKKYNDIINSDEPKLQDFIAWGPPKTKKGEIEIYILGKQHISPTEKKRLIKNLERYCMLYDRKQNKYVTSTSELSFLNKDLRFNIKDLDFRVLTDDIFVYYVQEQEFDIEAELIFYPPYANNIYQKYRDLTNNQEIEQNYEKMIKAKARKSLNEFLKEQYRIGRNISYSGIHKSLKVDGVNDVKIKSPLETLIILDNQVAIPRNIIIDGNSYDQ